MNYRVSVFGLALGIIGFGGCLGDDTTIESDEIYLAGANKVSLNKVSLNKVSLNKVSLNAVGLGSAISVNGQLEIATADLQRPLNDPLLSVTALAAPGGYQVAFDGTSTFLAIDLSSLRDLVDKSARCINAPGVNVTYNAPGDSGTFGGQFGLGVRGYTPERFIESFMACLAIFANDQSMSINVSADLIGTDITTTLAEFNLGYRVPDVAVGYLVTTTSNGSNTRLTGQWYWNLSRHTDWTATGAINLFGWQAARGRGPLPATTGRACLDAILRRDPMPQVCGGDQSATWDGRVVAGLSIPASRPGHTVCASRLRTVSPAPQPGTFDYNDYTKGVTCGPSSGDGQFSAVFYAELTTSLGFVNVNWQRLESEFAGYGSSGGGSGGSGS